MLNDLKLHAPSGLAITGAIVLAAGQAFAAPAPPNPPTPPLQLLSIADEPETRDIQTFTISGREGDRTTVVINNGEVSGTHNGEPLTARQIVRDERGGVSIIDRDGNVVIEGLGVEPLVATGIRAGAAPRIVARRGFPVGGLFEAQDAPRADTPVRIGITFDEPGEALSAQLGLKPGSAIVITGLVAGQPAERAGLKPNDIIVSLDGSDTASIDIVREVLAKKSPGDTLKVKVLRRGKPETFTLQLAPAAEVVVEGRRLPGLDTPPDAPVPPAPPQWRQRDNERFFISVPDAAERQTRAALEQALAEIERAMAEAEQRGADVREELAMAKRAIMEARERGAAELGRLRADFPGEIDIRAFTTGRPLRLWTGDAEDREHFDERVDQLEERFDELDERFDELEDRLDGIEGLLEDIAELIETRR